MNNKFKITKLERKNYLALEVNNCIMQLFIQGIKCYVIKYEQYNIKKKTVMEKLSLNDIQSIVNNMENLEFIFSIKEKKGNKIITNHVVGVRPILSSDLSGKIVFANLYDLFLLYNKFELKMVDFTWLKGKNLDQMLAVNSTFKLCIYSKLHFKSMSGLIDCITANYEKVSDILKIELDSYSLLESNSNETFDEYSLCNLYKYYIILNNLSIKHGKVINDDTKKIELVDDYFSDDAKIKKFLYDRFFNQTRFVDINNLLLRNKKKAIELLKNYE